MSSDRLGVPTSGVEVTNIGPHGFWLLVSDREYLLPYESYPWFKKATIEQILDVRLEHGCHLHWPSLDVDLSIEILEHPEAFPLISRS
ncbi:MAG: DUF2442 domain-containing protein [Candidatus Hydrogenedens sp.]|nr:DUF2442 domain-containing protein [Candidatus Hydrogenedens sp.]